MNYLKLLGLSAALHGYIAWRLLPALAAFPGGAYFLGMVLMGSAALVPMGLTMRFEQSFTAGLRQWGGMWVYTSRGTGYWGPPKRFGAPSEITRLRLVTA